MVLRKLRIGALEDAFQYDDTDFPDGAIVSDQPIQAGTPVNPDDVVRLSDVGTIAGDVYGPAGATDSNIVEFDGVTGKTLKDSGLTHANVSDAISKKHTQGTDTSLGILTSDIRMNDATKGLILKDTQGTPHYWRVTVDNSGNLVVTDIGTSLP